MSAVIFGSHLNLSPQAKRENVRSCGNPHDFCLFSFDVLILSFMVEVSRACWKERVSMGNFARPIFVQHPAAAYRSIHPD